MSFAVDCCCCCVRSSLRFSSCDGWQLFLLLERRYCMLRMNSINVFRIFPNSANMQFIYKRRRICLPFRIPAPKNVCCENKSGVMGERTMLSSSLLSSKFDYKLDDVPWNPNRPRCVLISVITTRSTHTIWIDTVSFHSYRRSPFCSILRSFVLDRSRSAVPEEPTSLLYSVVWISRLLSWTGVAVVLVGHVAWYNCLLFLVILYFLLMRGRPSFSDPVIIPSRSTTIHFFKLRKTHNVSKSPLLLGKKPAFYSEHITRYSAFSRQFERTLPSALFSIFGPRHSFDKKKRHINQSSQCTWASL